MKQIYKRCLSALLALLLLPGMLPTGIIVRAEAASAEKEAYRKLVQELIHEYGVYDRTLDFLEHPDNSGVADLACIDLTGDGTDELTVVMAEGQGVLSAAIYSYESGSAARIFHTGEVDAVTDFEIRRDSNGNAFLFVSSGKHWYSPYAWKNGAFVTGQLSDADDQQISQAASLGGLMDEGDKRYELQCGKLGIDPANQRTLFSFSSGFGNPSVGDVSTALATLGLTAPVDPTKLLSSISYYGDFSKCAMDAGMARAYANVLKNRAGHGVSYAGLDACLIDINSDGHPLLFTFERQAGSDFSVGVWEYQNGRAVEHDFSADCTGGTYGTRCFGRGFLGDKPILIVFFYGDNNTSETLWYTASNGQLSLQGALRNETDASYLNGVAYDAFSIDSVLQESGFEHTSDISCHEFSPPELYLDPSDSQSLADALTAYAAACSAYSYPRAEDVDESALVEAIAAAVANAVGGEVSAIYKLADGVYYIIITVNGSEKGALVLGEKQNGKVVWNVSEVHDNPLEQDALDALLSDILSRSNIELDYSKLQGADIDSVLDYLQDRLNNMSGLVPNDPAKNEIADFIESAISSVCASSVSSSDNRLLPDPDTVSALARKAETAKSAFEKLLADNGVTLTRALNIIIRILWRDMDSGAPCQITLDKTLLNAMGSCTVQLLLGDARHSVQLSPESLRKLVDCYGTVHIQLVRTEKGVYTINFLAGSGAILDKLDGSVGFALPADTELSTIMVSCSGGSINWGGQYDPHTQTVTFDASYSGQYEVLENRVSIADVNTLDAQVQDAIAFLVSKGYMSLNGDLFQPDAPLTRYEFAQALVGMFFALDTSLTTSFQDVPADSPYYAYVASGEAGAIIQGYNASTFGGSDPITMEQMLALAARTLMEHKGYTEPADAVSYLSAFYDGTQVSDWARSQIALAIREGLIDRGGMLAPLDRVSRSEAALILYRLFLLLCEVPTVAPELPPVTDSGEDAALEPSPAQQAPAAVSVILPIAGAVCAIAAGAAAAWWFLVKKKK